eukprot:TRINITY_DN16021_c0_g1_i4.p1 TRINITY_DN16021_c0_g1~~TRINITY_DN16021_c0_g1_i4.p1  ORF type:complete len:377 (+),score=90.92 TRINITY_DN16021_c0_g1_i4:144-1274(+)
MEDCPEATAGASAPWQPVHGPCPELPSGLSRELAKALRSLYEEQDSLEKRPWLLQPVLQARAETLPGEDSGTSCPEPASARPRRPPLLRARPQSARTATSGLHAGQAASFSSVCTSGSSSVCSSSSQQQQQDPKVRVGGPASAQVSGRPFVDLRAPEGPCDDGRGRPRQRPSSARPAASQASRPPSRPASAGSQRQPQQRHTLELTEEERQAERSASLCVLRCLHSAPTTCEVDMEAVQSHRELKQEKLRQWLARKDAEVAEKRRAAEAAARLAEEKEVEATRRRSQLQAALQLQREALVSAASRRQKELALERCVLDDEGESPCAATARAALSCRPQRTQRVTAATMAAYSASPLVARAALKCRRPTTRSICGGG